MVYYIVSVLFSLYFWCPCMAINVSVQYNGGLLPDIILVQLTSSRVINEMVLDGGVHFSPAGIDGVHTLTLFFSSYTAHSRAEGNPI